MDDATARKLADLETSLGLLQRDFETQNEMILLNAKAISQLELSVRRLLDKLESLDDVETPPSPEDDRPPHY